MRQRSDGRWEATATLPPDGSGRRRRLSGYGHSQSEALEDLARKREQEESGLNRAEARVEVGAWPDAWLESKSDRRYGTRRAYAQSIALLVPHIGKATLGGLTVQQVNRAIGAIAAASGAATARNAHAVLRNSLGDAVRLEIIPRNPAAKVIPPSSPRAVPEPWDLEGARAFLAAAVGHRLEALWVLSASTGMRPCEVLGLDWDGVDLDGGSLHVTQKLVTPAKKVGNPYLEPPKSKAGIRTLALAPTVVTALTAHRAAQDKEQVKAGDTWRDNNLVFTDRKGRPLRGDYVNKAFHDLVSAANLPSIRLYDLRRLAAALVLASTGGDLAEAKAQLGHSSISLAVETYGYRLVERSRATAGAIDAMLSGESDGVLHYPPKASRASR